MTHIVKGRKFSVGWWVLAWVAGMAPIVHVQAQQPPTCVWERVEPANLVAYQTTPSGDSKLSEPFEPSKHYIGLDSYVSPGKVPHPLLRVTGIGDIIGYQVTATIKVVGLRPKIASLMRNDKPPALNHMGYGYAHTFSGPGADPGHWNGGAAPIIQWDGDDFVWTWTFTGNNTSSGDHGFTLDTWWLLRFEGAPLDFKTSAYSRTHTFDNALSYTCVVNRLQ